jgi:putative heme degradation protein
MGVGITDTDPVAERFQVCLLRAADATRRLALALSLTDTVHDLARSAIARALHVADQTEVRLRFVEFHHGRHLADAVRRRLVRQPE